MTVASNYIDAMKGCALFAGLSISEQEEILMYGRSQIVPQGSCFFHQGEASLKMYVIIEGRVKLSQVNENGDQIIVSYFESGQGLGIVVALSGMPYPLSAEAIEPCEAIAWHRDQMKQLMLKNPQLALNGLEMVARRFVLLQERFSDLATRQVEQRVARTLLRLVRQFGERVPDGVLINIPLTRQSLAEMTGTNLYNVSRILSKWEREGWVRSQREKVTLCKAHELVVIGEGL